MLGEVYSDGGTLKVRTLSGAGSDSGLPCGSIIGIHSNTCPAGYLPCNGAAYDTTQYPALYAMLASDHLPDLREAVPVGIGLSDRIDIEAHDVYTLGQFKDDQVQTIPNGAMTSTDSTYTDAAGVPYSELGAQAPVSYPYRTGTTTHGKQYGVNYIIKATTGTVQIADPEIISMIEDWADARFSATDKEHAYDNCLFKYDATNDKLIPLTKPLQNNTVLTAEVTAGTTTHHMIYEMGGTYYLGSLQPTIQPAGEFVSQTSVGYVVVYNDVWYTNDTDWFVVTSMLNGALVYDNTDPVTDTDLIDALNQETSVEVFYQDWAETTDDSVDYEWKTGGSGSVSRFATMAEAVAALALEPGDEGYIPENGVVLVDELEDVLMGEDA